MPEVSAEAESIHALASAAATLTANERDLSAWWRIAMAFEELGKHSQAPAGEAAAAMAPQTVMWAIAEALVATAIGLAVAIPAVMAFNFFQRVIKSTLANTETLSGVLMSYLHAVDAGAAPPPSVSHDGDK